MKLLNILIIFSLPNLTFAEKPNIILFYVDDFGARDLSCYGSYFYETPHMDALASEGVKFTRAYSAYPRCLPARQALLSGKYPSRITYNSIREDSLKKKSNHALPLEEVTFGEAFQKHGYETCYIGKWHLGKKGGDPSSQGFSNIVHTGAAGATRSFFHPFSVKKNKFVLNPVKGKKGDYLGDLLTDKAIEYIEDKKDQTFLMVVALYAVHGPFEAPINLVKKYKKKLISLGVKEGGKARIADYDLIKDRLGYSKSSQNNPTYAGMIENTDKCLGRIVDKLEKLNLDRKTIIILTSDHGGLSTRGLDRKRTLATSNYPLRQGKGSIFEGGVRVPLIVKWPGKAVEGSISEVLVNGTDHYPTMLEMAGLPLMPEQHVDGRSYMKATQGENCQRDGIFCYKWMARPDSTGDSRAISFIEGDYKVIEWLDEDKIELYNINEDISEKTDISEKYPDITKNLLKKMYEIEQDVGDHREAGRLQLKRRLSQKYGGLQKAVEWANKNQLDFIK